MQRRFFSLFLAVFMLLVVLCGGNESLSVFNGKMVVMTAPLVKGYEYLPHLYQLRHDSLRWIYEYPPTGESRVNLILRGQIKTDSIDDFGDTIPLGIGENHIELSVLAQSGGLYGPLQVVFDTSGFFLDTVSVAVSPFPGVVLPCSSSLFINVGNKIFDTIPLFGPHPAAGGGVAP